MKKSIVLLFLVVVSSVFSQEKKLLLRFNEILTSELDIENEKYIDKGKTKALGTILVYSKSVVIYDETTQEFETYEISEMTKDKKRDLYITKDKEYVFALPKDRRYFTRIGKKDRLIFKIINYKYAEETKK